MLLYINTVKKCILSILKELYKFIVSFKMYKASAQHVLKNTSNKYT